MTASDMAYYSILRCAFVDDASRTFQIHILIDWIWNFGLWTVFFSQFIRLHFRLISILSNEYIQAVCVVFDTHKFIRLWKFIFYMCVSTHTRWCQLLLGSKLLLDFGQHAKWIFDVIATKAMTESANKFVIKFICWLVIKCNQAKVNEAK